MWLQVPQVTIATTIIFCHRFFIYQPHVKNDRKVKLKSSPSLKNVILTSYEIIHKKDATAVQKIKQKEVYEQQKELILVGEKIVLATLAFDLNVLRPYKFLLRQLRNLRLPKMPSLWLPGIL
ncbi:hypothetical protein ABFS83_04G228100 [Erythranthe nasuta]